MYEVNEICGKGESLDLTTQGQLRVVFLGTGAAFSRRNRQSNILLIQDNDHLLVDCGSQGSLALQDVGLTVKDINVYLPTHSHADHVGGLEEVALMNRYTSNATKPQMIILPDYQQNLWEKTLSGGMEFCDAYQQNPLQLPDYFEILQPKPIEIRGCRFWAYQHGPIEIIIMKTHHFPKNGDTVDASQWCCGVLINNRVWISGDTVFDASYPEFFHEKAEVMFHDCQLYPGGVHASYAELMTLPEEIRKKIYLYHYGDNWDKPDSWVTEEESFTGDPVKDGFLGWTQPQVAYDFN